MTNHEVMICNTESKRLATLNINVEDKEDWFFACKSAAASFIGNENMQYLSCHISNGRLIVWVVAH